jgi:hypothetical protein
MWWQTTNSQIILYFISKIFEDIRIVKKKYVFAFEKEYFDTLSLKPLGLYVNLLGPFVDYSQPFHLVYK